MGDNIQPEEDEAIDLMKRADKARAIDDKCTLYGEAYTKFNQAHKKYKQGSILRTFAAQYCARTLSKYILVLHDYYHIPRPEESSTRSRPLSSIASHNFSPEARDEIGGYHKHVITYCDLAFSDYLDHFFKSGQYLDELNQWIEEYKDYLIKALEFALAVQEKHGVWLVESYISVIKPKDKYPQFWHLCYWYLARIHKKTAWKLLNEDKFELARGYLRDGTRAATEARKLVSNEGESTNLKKTEDELKDYGDVAGALQRISQATILMNEGLNATGEKNLIAHEAIDLFRAAVNLAEGKHTRSCYQALKGISCVYKTFMNNSTKAKEFEDKALAYPEHRN